MCQSSEEPTPVNPYESSATASSGQSVRPAIRFSFVFVLAVLLNGGLFAAIVLTRRPMGSIFVDFEVELPFAATIALSPWTLVGIGGLFVFTIAKQFFPSPPAFTRIFNWLVCLATVVLGFAYGFAVLLPLIGLIKALS
jgi:hypothetical protein